MGISLEDVRTAIVNANAAGPLGAFDGDGVAEIIGINDQTARCRRIRADIVVKTANGTVIRLLGVDRDRRASVAQQPLRRLVQQGARRCC